VQPVLVVLPMPCPKLTRKLEREREKLKKKENKTVQENE